MHVDAVHGAVTFSGRQAEQLDRIRALCLAYPEATEVEQFGHPWFKAGKRPFCVVGLEGGQVTVGLSTSHDDQSVLIETGPFVPAPYMHQHGWVRTTLDADPPWDLLAQVLDSAYRHVALRRMLKALDGDPA